MSRTRPETCDDCALHVAGACTEGPRLRADLKYAHSNRLGAKALQVERRLRLLDTWLAHQEGACPQGELRTAQALLGAPTAPPTRAIARVAGPAIVCLAATAASCGMAVETYVEPDSNERRGLDYWKAKLGTEHRLEVWYRDADADWPTRRLAIWRPAEGDLYAPPPPRVHVVATDGREFAAKVRPEKHGEQWVYAEVRRGRFQLPGRAG